MTDRMWLAILIVAVHILSNAFSYHLGKEDGYWEHEAEENAYVCTVYDA
jgi:hypothetical protein